MCKFIYNEIDSFTFVWRFSDVIVTPNDVIWTQVLYIRDLSVGQGLWFHILLDMVRRSSISIQKFDLGQLFKIKVKEQGQGHIRWTFSHATIWIQHEVSTTNRTKVMANMRVWRFYDVTMRSNDVIRTKCLYLRNLWAATFDLIYFSTWLDEVRIFRKVWPGANFSRLRSKVKVKVTWDAPRVMLSYNVNLKCLPQ